MKAEKKIIGIIVGRMNSTRFPGKMEHLLCGTPLLEFVINRARRALQSFPVVVATSANALDNRIEDIAAQNNTECFRGDLGDVAGRLLKCAIEYNADYFVRLNGDSPLIDNDLISRGLQICQQGDYDLITNIYERSYPYGISLEIIKTSVFKTVYLQMEKSQQEHPTSYFYQHSKKFKIFNIKNDIECDPKQRFAIDFPADLKRLNRLLDNDISKAWRDFV